MPTIFSHSIVAALASRAGLAKDANVSLLAVVAVCAVIPDLDVAGFALGIPYDSMLGHRGFTHSIAFAIILGAIGASCYQRLSPSDASFTRLFIIFSLGAISHPVLDMLTDGGHGVALLAPFSGERFFFPWRPIRVSPIGSGFFSERGLAVILSEIVWLWIPAIFVCLAAAAVRKISR